MPTYMIRDTETDEVFEKFCSYKQLQQILNENPKYVHVVGTPMIVSGVGNLHSKTPNGFKDVLNGIKKGAGKNSTIKT